MSESGGEPLEQSDIKEKLGRIADAEDLPSPTPIREQEDKFFDKILGDKQSVQRNQVFLLICGILILLLVGSIIGSMWFKDSPLFEQFFAILDRALFILLGFLIKETLSKSRAS